MAFKLADYKNDYHNDWCAGCGDFGILSSLHKAFQVLQLEPHRTVVVSGIGCSSKTPHFVQTFGVHTLHGRSIPFASGLKIANPELEVIAVGGDGDGYGIGAGHFVSAGRRNLDMAYVVFNNEVYGLTKGQASPTLKRGEQPKGLPLPNINDAVNPIALALTAGFTWIGRGYSYDVKGLTDLIVAAMKHRGAALLDVIQPCPTYNNLHTKEFWAEKVETPSGALPRIARLSEEGYDGRVADPADIDEISRKRVQAFERGSRVEERMPVGVFYEIDLPTYTDRIASRMPGQKFATPATLSIADPEGRPTTDIDSILEDFRF
jgi:2-oxoglutarate ferredoxin oxidoreductase subunit beta